MPSRMLAVPISMPELARDALVEDFPRAEADARLDHERDPETERERGR